MIRIGILLLYCNIIYAGHFSGGTITWTPSNPYNNGSSVAITIQQTYWWAYPSVKCASNVPASTPGRSSEVSNLICVVDCSTDGGYSSSPIKTLTDCVQLSSAMGIMTSQRTVNKTLTANSHFYLSYVGNAWRSLGNPAVSALQWSIVTYIDLRLRPDGFINTPPVASVLSPRYVIVNTLTQIKISVSDANTGDDVRCRWSTYTNGHRRRREVHEDLYVESTSSDQTGLISEGPPRSFSIKSLLTCVLPCFWACYYGCPCSCLSCSGTTCTSASCLISSGCVAVTVTIDTTATMKPTTSFPIRQAINECGGVCFPSSMPIGTNLSNCTISFKGTVENRWYAAAIQVEDFINETSNTPMSSTPVQCLIYVMPQPSCSTPPEIIPVTRCFEVTVGVQQTINITALNECDPDDISMADILITKDIVGVNKSDMVMSPSNSSLAYVTIVWIPTDDQIGLQQLCTVAYTEVQIQSDEYCMTFNVTTSYDVCPTTTTSTTSTSTTSTSTTSRTTTTSVTTTTTTSTTTSTTSTATTTTTSTTTTTTASTTTTTTTSTTTTTTTSTTTTTTTSTTTTSTTTSSTTTTSVTTTTTSTTTTVTTESTTSITTTTITTAADNTGPSWGLLAGILASVLPLALCCSCCLYQHLWSSRAKLRPEQEQTAEEQRRYHHITSNTQNSFRSTSDINENNRIRKPSKAYQVYDISSTSTTMSPVNANLSTDNQTSILVTMYNNTNNRFTNRSRLLTSPQSFEMYDMHDRSNTANKRLNMILDVQRSNETFNTSHSREDGFRLAYNQPLNFTQSLPENEGLISKYIRQEQNRNVLN